MRFGKKSKIRLSKPFIDGVIHEASTMLSRKEFFGNAPCGVNMLNGFISITEAGDIKLLEHSPEHRQLYCLAYQYKEPQGSTHGGFLDKLLTE